MTLTSDTSIFMSEIRIDINRKSILAGTIVTVP